MTELELRRNGSVHVIRVPEGASLAEAVNTLEQWARDWERSKRKVAA